SISATPNRRLGPRAVPRSRRRRMPSAPHGRGADRACAARPAGAGQHPRSRPYGLPETLPRIGNIAVSQANAAFSPKLLIMLIRQGGRAAAGLDFFQHSFERFQPISLQLLASGVVTAIMPRP